MVPWKVLGDVFATQRAGGLSCPLFLGRRCVEPGGGYVGMWTVASSLGADTNVLSFCLLHTVLRPSKFWALAYLPFEGLSGWKEFAWQQGPWT